MATVAAKPMTAEEFFEFANRPENRGRIFELEEGEIIEMPRPGKTHGFICGNVARILGNFAARQKKGYVCANDTGVIVKRGPDTVRGPDLMFFDDATTVDDIEKKYGTTPPRLAVEVLSPNDTHGKLLRRVREQLRFGTPLVWVIDPEARNISVYRPGKVEALLEMDEDITGEDVLPDFRCKVAEFFAMPGQ